MASFWALCGFYEPSRIADGRGTAFIAPLFMWSYLMLAIVLFVNLLIAMFSSSYNTVSEDSDAEWKFLRVLKVKTYMQLDAWPTPLNLPGHLFDIFMAIFCRMKVGADDDSGEAKRNKGAQGERVLKGTYNFTARQAEAVEASAREKLHEVRAAETRLENRTMDQIMKLDQHVLDNEAKARGIEERVTKVAQNVCKLVEKPPQAESAQVIELAKQLSEVKTQLAAIAAANGTSSAVDSVAGALQGAGALYGAVTSPLRRGERRERGERGERGDRGEREERAESERPRQASPGRGGKNIFDEVGKHILPFFKVRCMCCTRPGGVMPPRFACVGGGRGHECATRFWRHAASSPNIAYAPRTRRSTPHASSSTSAAGA